MPDELTLQRFEQSKLLKCDRAEIDHGRELMFLESGLAGPGQRTGDQKFATTPAGSVDSATFSSTSLLNSNDLKPGWMQEFGQAALHAGIQSPLQGLAQLADKGLGTDLEKRVTFMSAPKESEFMSSTWHAHQLGSMVGMAAPFLLLHKGVGLSGNMLFGKLEQNAARDVLIRRAVWESAATGAMFDGLLRPVAPAQDANFAQTRIGNALVGAATFGVLTRSAIGIQSLMHAERGLGAAIIRSEIGSTMLSGIPAGIVNAELSSRFQYGTGASRRQMLESVYSFSVLGGTMAAGKHVIGGTYTDTALSKDLKAESLEARQSGAPTLGERLQGGLDRLWTSVGNIGRVGQPRLAFAEIPAGVGEQARSSARPGSAERPLLLLETGETPGLQGGKAQEVKAGPGKSDRPTVGPVVEGPVETARAATAALDFSAPLEPLRGPALERVHSELPEPQKGTIHMRELKGDAPRHFESDAHFSNSLNMKEVQAVVYEIDGVSVAVPEGYNAKLAKVRQYRIELGKNTGESPMDIARRVLGEDVHLANRALPEDFRGAIQLLPDKKGVRIVLSDKPNPQDVYDRQRLGNDGFSSQASTSREGEVTFYMKENDGYLHSDLGHEFAHLVKYRNEVLGKVFGYVSLLEHGEKNPYYSRDYARLKVDEAGRVDPASVEENWAVHMGEEFLHPNAVVFERFITEAPMRSYMFALALKPFAASSKVLAARIAKVEAEVGPRVNNRLVEIVQGAPDSAAADMALRVLAHTGKPEHAARLTGVSSLSLRGEPISDQSLPFITAIPGLTHLDLSSTWITRSATGTLGGLSRLEVLGLSGTRVDNSSLVPLRKMTGLTSLDLSYTEITNGGLAHLPTKGNLAYVNFKGTAVSRPAITLMLERFATKPTVEK